MTKKEQVVLVTRPDEEGLALANQLKTVGKKILLEPMLIVENLPVKDLSYDKTQAYVITSANSIKALLNLRPDLEIPLFAVGNASAIAARKSGFKTVYSADGDADDLAKLVDDILNPSEGDLLYISGKTQSGNLFKKLSSLGFGVSEVVVYETIPRKSLSPATVAAIKNDQVDTILLYSSKTAEVLIKLIRKSRLVRQCKKITIICLSKGIANVAKSLNWYNVLVSDKPTQEGMLDLLEKSTLKQTQRVSMENNKNSDVKSNEDSLTDDSVNAATPIPKKKYSLKAIIYSGLIGAFIVSAGLATSDLWTPRLHKIAPFLQSQNITEKNISLLIQRLEKLELQTLDNMPRLEELEEEKNRLTDQAKETLDRIGALEKSIGKAKKVVSSIEAQILPGNSKQGLTKLIERLDEIEKDTITEASKTEKNIGALEKKLENYRNERLAIGKTNGNTVARAFLVGVGQLRLAIKTGKPFVEELKSLEAINIGEEAKDIIEKKLRDESTKGITKFSEIRLSFQRIAGKVVSNSKIEIDEEDLVTQIFSRISDSVTWRKTSQLIGTGVEAIVARAEDNLIQGDLESAINELESLEPKAKLILGDWLQAAKKHITANKAVSSLQNIAISQLVNVER